MRILSSLLVAVLVVAVPARAAESHVIELKNGTKLVGTIQKQEGGKVYINAELLGPVVVDASSLVTTETAAEAATPPASTKPAPVVASTPSGAPAAPPKADPNKITWKRSLSINGSAAYVQGPIPGAPPGSGIEGAGLGLSGKQSTVQVNGMILRASPTMAVTLTGGYGYAKYEPAGAVVNNWNGEFTFTRILSPKNYILTRSTYKVDKIALIDHSFEQVVGYGFKLIETERTKFDVIPGLSEVNEKKGTAFDDQWIFSAGSFQHSGIRSLEFT